MLEFFDQVVTGIHQNKEDGSLCDVFKPVLDSVKTNMTNDSSLINPSVIKTIDFMSFFTRNPALAEVFCFSQTLAHS